MRLTVPTMAIAASLAAAAVIVPAAFYVLSNGARQQSPGLPVTSAGKPAESPVVKAERGRVATGIKLGDKPVRVAKREHELKRRLAIVRSSGLQRPRPKSKPNADDGVTQIAAVPRPAMDVPQQDSGLLQMYSSSNRTIGALRRDLPTASPETGRDRFAAAQINPVRQVESDPVSTFSIDVDTASYGFVRRSLNAGTLPPKAAVRIEEMLNYFNYTYRAPESAQLPFAPVATVVPSPWSKEKKLLHIALKGHALNDSARPRANLVFLIDVSGSMTPAPRLPLLKNAFKMLLEQLQPDDTVGIVTYASGSSVVLEPTKVSEKAKIVLAIDQLRSGGSTAGAQGIQDAYRLAETAFERSAVNRVILGTDGDFNVGISNVGQLKSYIERKRKSGVYLSILGVGRGNYNDALMQALAQNGNGTAAYIDTLNEARKVLVEEASSTLFPIAKDVKVQIEFNPAVVRDYRLIGYETRALKRQDFNNDRIDAGEVGSGHAVTAIYEFTPVAAKQRVVDGLRYARPVASTPATEPDQDRIPGEIAFLKLRYKLPQQTQSTLQTLAIETADELSTLEGAAGDVRFAVAVAAFGQLLRENSWLGDYNYDDVIALASSARGDDAYGLRAEFVNLVRLAKTINR